MQNWSEKSPGNSPSLGNFWYFLLLRPWTINTTKTFSFFCSAHLLLATAQVLRFLGTARESWWEGSGWHCWPSLFTSSACISHAPGHTETQAHQVPGFRVKSYLFLPGKPTSFSDPWERVNTMWINKCHLDKAMSWQMTVGEIPSKMYS